jgi:tetratricopeptide (TPR) repeat protein
MSVSNLIARAIELHRAGDLLQAESLYRGILQKQPDHADALHLLGMLRHADGDPRDAERLIRRAISIHPNQPVYHSNLGIVLAAAGKLTEATDAYRRARDLDPRSALALNNLGVALHAAGSTEQAVDCFKRAVILQPDYPDAQQNLLRLRNLETETAEAHHAIGNLLQDGGKSADAIGFYRNALALNPASAATWNNLGNSLFAAGETEQAFDCYEKAVKLKPDFSEACNNLANLLAESGRLAEAIALYVRAIELQPDFPDLLSNLGNALREAGQLQPAMDCYNRAFALDPDHVKTHNNLGNAYCELGEWPKAIESYRRAIAIDPNFGEAINNLGTAMEELGQRAEAMACYQTAAQLAPNSVSPPWNIALLQLLLGDYENGWPGYEHRWRQKKQCKSFRNFPQPLLNLSGPVRGKRVLLHAEQGFGDALQFCRYVPMVADLGAEVILECPPSLVRLFRSLKGVGSVIARAESVPCFDLQCPLMSLPMVFSTTLKSIPVDLPYLHAEPADIQRWRSRFATEPVALRVGLIWAGDSKHQKDRHRSLTLSDFAPLARVPGIGFYSVQVGKHSVQAKSPPAGMQLIDWTADLQDFADTAAMISQLDLVITVDTAVAHLTGALGKPVWILIPFQPDWRWLLDRTDSPWYPSARLFRQSVPGQWEQPLEELIRAVRDFASGSDSLRP